jgi:hypothetical protein
MYLAKIEARVAGIPCLIGVISNTPGSYHPRANSTFDYYGSSLWEVLDRRGRRAVWLEKKLSSDDESRIDALITSFFEE